MGRYSTTPAFANRTSIAALLFLDSCVQTIEVIEVRDVAPNRKHVSLDQAHGLVQLCLASARDEDVGAFLDKSPGCGEPYVRCFRPVRMQPLPWSG